MTVPDRVVCSRITGNRKVYHDKKMLDLMRSRLLDGLSRAVGRALLAGTGRGKQHASDNGKGEYFFHFVKDEFVVSQNFRSIQDR